MLTWTVRSHDQEVEARRVADGITFEVHRSQLYVLSVAERKT